MKLNIDLLKNDTLVDYKFALDFMKQKVKSIQEGSANSMLWLLEHPPLYTAGTGANDNEILVDKPQFPIYETGRGGKHTYHGPGQRIAYIMLDLKKAHDNKPDLKLFVKQIQNWVINSLARINIQSFTRDDRVGVWVNTSDGNEEKIAAIGIRVEKYVSYHGVAINIMPNMSHYKDIVPCGIKDYGVTSMEKLGLEMSMDEFDKILIEEFQNVFGCVITKVNN